MYLTFIHLLIYFYDLQFIIENRNIFTFFNFLSKRHFPFQMNKAKLRKISNLKNLKFKEYRQISFAKHSIIIRKNESFRHVYFLKSGEAGIFSEDGTQELLHRYKQGDCLNKIQFCMSVNSFKTIKAISRCQTLLQIWDKQHQDQEKKNSLIPKIQELKFHQIALFKSLQYGVMVQLGLHFKKLTVSKLQIMTILNGCKGDSTCFIISGVLTLESCAKKHQYGLRRTKSCQTRQSKDSGPRQKNLRLSKFQRGQMLFLDMQNRYKYSCQTQICQIITISTNLLSYFLSPELSSKIGQLKQTQSSNLLTRQSTTHKALEQMNRKFDITNCKSEAIPQKLKNQIQNKCQKFEKARSVYYTKNNRNFRSYSEEKTKILQLRDKGYKQISEMNRRKYGRNYIYEKRMEISRNIHGDCLADKQTPASAQKGPALKRGVTVYQSVTLKDDYGVMKQSPLMKFIRRSRSIEKKNYTSHQTSPFKRGKNDQQIQNLTLKSVQRIRKNFQDRNKTLLKNFYKKQVNSDF